MSLDLQPAADRENVQRTLEELKTGIFNARSGSGDERFLAYVRWANTAVGQLRNQLRSHEVERLVLTRRYWILQGLSNFPGGPSMNALLNTEIEERIEAFEIATKTLRDWIERWKRAGAFAVVDTTVFLEHSDKLEEWDLAEEIGARSNPVHILVPLAVVDELDKRKKIGDNHRRWRAGYSVALLDKLLRFDRVSVLREADWEPADGRPRGEVTIEVVMDAPGHVRLSDVDSEIVARAASLQVLAGRPIKLVTYDTGMAMRARFAGIGAVHLRKDLGPEPPTS